MERALITFTQAVAADPGVSAKTRDAARMLELAIIERLRDDQDAATATTGTHNDF
jgi:hypothetical protein